MPERLNVYLPDDLHRALERHRGSLNVSRICQEALAREVARLESLGAAEESLPTLSTDERGVVAGRLRTERERRRKYWYGLGYRLAFEWARDRAGPDELRAVAEGAALEAGVDAAPALPAAPATLPAGARGKDVTFNFKFATDETRRHKMQPHRGRAAAIRAWSILRDEGMEAARASGGPPEDMASFNRGLRDAAMAVWDAVAADVEEGAGNDQGDA